MSKNLRIIPLGGLGEIGKNITALEYGRNLMLVDCGVMFPENDMFGIDLVLPQFDYLLKNQDMLRGIVITHGHLDHTGSLPYLLKQMKLKTGERIPVYGTALTLGMVEHRLAEMNVQDRANLIVFNDRQTVQLGPFRVSPYAAAHSIPDSVGLVIDTPVGAVVHTGDYKLDETPAGGQRTDLKRLRKLTPNGVIAMLGDSTNADRPGRTPTEKVVADTLDGIFAQAKGQRIIIATFSSLLARLQEILLIAQKYGRKVALTGLSLEQNIQLARDLGYMKVPDGLIVDIRKKTPPEKLVILSTGSQGEPRSALNRMAEGEHKHIQVHATDTIIISGGTIPGNEEDVGRMLNNLFGLGANVIYGPMATVHVSGHGSQEDMRIMLDHVRPRFLIPAHGEMRHLHLHARMAYAAGMQKDQVFILENGSTWNTDGQRAWLDEPVPAGDVYVDGNLTGQIGDVVMRDRVRLSQDGFVVVYIPVDRNNRLAGEPRLVSRGFLHMNSSEHLMEAARLAIKQELQAGDGKRHETPVQRVTKKLQDLFYEKTQLRPVVLPSLVEVYRKKQL